MKNMSSNPNDGENVKFYDSSSSRSGTTGVSDSAGVMDGLSMVEKFDPEAGGTMASENQRPESRIDNIGGGMKIGA